MSDANTEIVALKRQVRFLWLSLASMLILLVAGICTGAMILGSGKSVARNTIATSLRIGPTANGDTLALTGDGFVVANEKGETIVQLKDDSDKGPALTLQRWTVPNDWADALLGKKAKAPATPIMDGELDLSAEKVSMIRGVAPRLTLDTSDGGQIWLSDRNFNNSVFSANMWSTGNTCSFDAETCYESSASISGGWLGLRLVTCEKHKGMPVNDKNRDQGCTGLSANSRGGDGEGSSISVNDDGVNRITMGSTVLTSKQVGGTVVTPASQLTVFDKNGNVILKIPQY